MKMLVDLSKQELIYLIKGTAPLSYEMMEHPLIRNHYYYFDGHSVSEGWNHGAFENYTEEKLWEVYQLITAPKHEKTKKETWYEQQVREIKELLIDGQDRGNQGQVDACLLEIERLEKLM